MKKLIFKTTLAFFCALLLGSLFSATQAQQASLASKMERERGQMMLKMIKEDIKKNYYDPNFRGIDIEAHFKTANDKIEQAKSVGQIMGIIAQSLLDFDDSHTRFIPPSRANKTEYGWKMQAIGDKCYVVAVKPNTDAEAKGLKVGDEVLAVDGFEPSREILWKINYAYYSVRPQPGMKLLVRHPSGKEEEIIVLAKVTTGRRINDLTGAGIWDFIRKSESEDYLNRHRFQSFGEEVLIWKMPEFDMTDQQVDEAMDKAKKHKSLILDLRGNGGGYVKTLNRLVSNFFDRDIKIADLKGRKEFDPQIAKTRGDKVYKGKLVVLIDSESGSAAEVFARIIQLEQRGTVIGDRSAGAVMMSRYYSRQIGMDTVIFFGANITAADLIMSDGKSIEKIGVNPDETILPNSEELFAQKDRALSRAMEILGLKLDPSEAGKMFPIEWAK